VYKEGLLYVGMWCHHPKGGEVSARPCCSYGAMEKCWVYRGRREMREAVFAIPERISLADFAVPILIYTPLISFGGLNAGLRTRRNQVTYNTVYIANRTENWILGKGILKGLFHVKSILDGNQGSSFSYNGSQKFRD